MQYGYAETDGPLLSILESLADSRETGSKLVHYAEVAKVEDWPEGSQSMEKEHHVVKASLDDVLRHRQIEKETKKAKEDLLSPMQSDDDI